jgi:hypothetical protein
LTQRDSGSGKKKSWVIGLQAEGHQKAIDWNLLLTKGLIEDSLPGIPLVVWVEKDSASFHAYRRKLNNQVLQFNLGQEPNTLQDLQTGSVWNTGGKAIAGPLAGQRLQPIRAYQAFWHSWQTFHP